MKKGILTSLGLAAVLTLGLASVNEYREVKEVDAEEEVFTKVTTNLDDWSGDYLVVNENAGSAKVLNGALSTINAAGNYVSSTIDNNQIKATTDIVAAAFKVEAVTGGYTMLGSSGYYIGSNSYENGLPSSKSVKYVNNFSIDAQGNAIITANGNTNGKPTLQYNSTWGGFRFYKTQTQQKVSLYKYTGGASVELSTSDNIQASLIIPYYGVEDNEGVYTKKTQIYVNETGKNEIKKSFLGTSVQLDRTTYYNGTSLLMGDYDGGFDQINSGYGTDDKGNLTHFKLSNVANGTITTPTYSANNTHPNWHDKDEEGKNIGEGMEGFYMTLNDMTKKDYFEGWSFEDEKATYEAEEEFIDGSNKFVQDFLAFTAPCLQPMVLDAASSNYFQITKLEILEDKHVNWGEYLSLKMYVSSTNESLVIDKNTLVLSEARIYTGNQIIDEDVNAKLTIKSVSGGKVESSHENGMYYKPDGQTITFTVTPYEDYELTGLTVTNNNEPLDIEFNPTGCEFNVQMNGDVVVTPEFTKVETGDDSGDTLAPITEPISISFANANQRTEFSTTRQVWVNNGVTLINDKAASTSNVVNNTNPVRLYANSSITIECTGTFNKILFVCSGSSYVTALVNTLNSINDSNCTITNSGNNVTVLFNEPVSKLELPKLAAQVRLTTFTVSYENN